MRDQAGDPPIRDVVAFHARAAGYDHGWRGRMHHRISDRVAAIAADAAPDATRVLDVGCGTGYLLRLLGAELSAARELVGVDAAEGMVDVAKTKTSDPRVDFVVANAEGLPLRGGFDLVVTCTSFDHWRDQRAGLAECARVLAPGGALVLCDLVSPLLAPTMSGSRKEKARTRHRVNALLREVGLVDAEWHGVYTVLIKAVVARKP